MRHVSTVRADVRCRTHRDDVLSGVSVTGLNTYPVKSCAGVALAEARVTERGIEHDRDFMVVDDDNDFVSQRKVPELALVRPTIGHGSIALTAPGVEDITVPLESDPADTRLITATVHGRPVSAAVLGDGLAEWFTTVLPPYRGNRRFRLVRVRDDAPAFIRERYRKPGASNQVGFADGNAMLLATEPSLARLNAQMNERVPMNRFRPNIVVDGDDLAPYDEDRWTEIRIGALAAYVVKACDRCAIPDTDQDTATVGKAVRVALRTRRGVNAHDGSNTGVFFGQNLNHVFAPGIVVKLGDALRVITSSARPNVVLDRA
jgi:uncharacterized protein YcbX